MDDEVERSMITDHIVERQEALARIAEQDLARLSEKERASLLRDWWSTDAEDPEFAALPPSLQRELLTTDAPPDPMAPHCDALLRIALRSRLRGLRNEYLAARLRGDGEEPIEVRGEVEPMDACPCCRYLTLPERGGYDICAFCFWEDDGSEALDLESGPNRMTLRQARVNFETFGAMERRCLQFVVKGPADR